MRTVAPLDRPTGAKAAHLPPFSFRAAVRTHPGVVRKLNEDACLDRSDVGLWAVADGMGGHAAGEVASGMVADALYRVDAFGSAFAVRRAVRNALAHVNDRLQGMADEQLSGPIGSTVVTLMAHGGHFACIWAGDSRAYLRRHGDFERISRDHSVVQELVDAGKLEAHAAGAHERRNVVTRAVGASERLELDGVYGRIADDDRFLLCSDGLSGALADHELAALCAGGLNTAADALMQRALAKGATDNVSLVLIEAMSMGRLRP